MRPLLCDQPQTDTPALPCPQTAVYGTSRCLEHLAPRRTDITRHGVDTVVLKPLVPIPAGDVLLGESLPSWFVPCGCGSCPDLPKPPADDPVPVEPVVVADEPAVEAGPVLPPTAERPAWVPVSPSQRGWLLRAIEGIFG